MARRLYGVPVAVTNSIDVGSSLVGAFRDSERIYRTGAASITIHDSAPRTVGEATVADYAVNQLVLRAEMRAEVAPWRGSGFVLSRLRASQRGAAVFFGSGPATNPGGAGAIGTPNAPR